VLFVLADFHVPCFVSAVSLLRRLYFATKVRHVHSLQHVVRISGGWGGREGTYIRNNSNDSPQAIFTAVYFVLLLHFKLVFLSRCYFGLTGSFVNSSRWLHLVLRPISHLQSTIYSLIHMSIHLTVHQPNPTYTLQSNHPFTHSLTHSITHPLTTRSRLKANGVTCCEQVLLYVERCNKNSTTVDAQVCGLRTQRLKSLPVTPTIMVVM
jgi:hypothetical protein